MKAKKLIISALCAATALSCGAFGGCSENYLIVYTESGFAPWEFTQKGSTKIIGVDMEIAKYIAKKYDYTLKVVDVPFDTIVAGISEDNALGIAAISYDAERASRLEYSNFYYGDAFQAVVYMTSSNPTITEGAFAVSNFEGSTLVYQTGTTSQTTVADNQAVWGYKDTKDFTTVHAALEEIKTTSGCYLVVDSQVAAQLAAQNTGVSFAPIEGITAEQYGIIAKKGNTALIEKVNAALAELLVEDTQGKNQIEKWFDLYNVYEAE